MARTYTHREARLLTEWAVREFPGAELRFRVQLGAYDPSLDDSDLSQRELRALGVWRRFVDLLVVEPGRIHLVEAKLRGEPGALEQLDLYARLVPLTPELAPYRERPIVRHLVWAIRDPVIEAIARERGIVVHLFSPPWVDEYFTGLAARKRAQRKESGLLGAQGELLEPDPRDG